MPNPIMRRLALVVDPALADRDADEMDRAESLAHRLEEILRDRSRARVAADSRPASDPAGYLSPKHGIPFCIKLTIEQILDVAEDADIRALMLDDVEAVRHQEDVVSSVTRIPRSALIRRRAQTLHDVAIELRRIASRLIDDWAGPRGSSSRPRPTQR